MWRNCAGIAPLYAPTLLMAPANGGEAPITRAAGSLTRQGAMDAAEG